MAMLLHGSTRLCAEQLMAHGPDPNFVEPGGAAPANGFSTSLHSGPFPLGTPQPYACGQAAGFQNEGGPAILMIDVPDNRIALAVDEFFPLSQGVGQFDDGKLRLASS